MSTTIDLPDRPQIPLLDQKATTVSTTTAIAPTDAFQTETTTHPTATSDDSRTHRVTLSRVVSSEWLKFRTVRANTIALASAAVAAVGLGALFSSFAGTDDGPRRFADNALSLTLAGFQVSQLIIAILGVAIVAGEYQTGLIRTWFGAAPDRIRVLVAKVGVFGSATFATMLVAAFAAFFAGQALLPDSWTALAVTDAGVLQALVGTAFYAACIGVIGVGLGFLLRSTAAGAGVVVGTLMVAPLLVSLLPSSIAEPLGKVLPSNAGTAMAGVESTSELLSAGWGFVVLIGWVLAIVGAAAVSLRRRDA